jgi:hypothetical protein
MKIGDKVMTVDGMGILGDFHRMRKGEKDCFLNDLSYPVYAVKMLSNNVVRYFSPEEIKSIRTELVEDRLTGTLYEMEVYE